LPSTPIDTDPEALSENPFPDSAKYKIFVTFLKWAAKNSWNRGFAIATAADFTC